MYLNIDEGIYEIDGFITDKTGVEAYAEIGQQIENIIHFVFGKLFLTYCVPKKCSDCENPNCSVYRKISHCADDLYNALLSETDEIAKMAVHDILPLLSKYERKISKALKNQEIKKEDTD